MRHALSLAVVAMALAGCSFPPEPYGPDMSGPSVELADLAAPFQCLPSQPPMVLYESPCENGLCFIETKPDYF